MSRRARAARARQDLGRRRERPPAPGRVRLSVVVPAYEEAERIGATVARICAELEPRVGVGELEVLVVDDGSSDGTAAAARRAGAHRVVALPVNRGKGHAVRAGVLAASGRTVAFTDADLAYSPDQVHGLLEAVEAGWDVVVGNRHHASTTTTVAAPPVRRLGSQVVNLATRLVLDVDHTDTQCGLKAFRADVARVLFGHARVDGFAFDVELFVLVERYGFSLQEVAVDIENSPRSTVNVARDAVRLLVDLLRIRRAVRAGTYDLGPGELAALTPGTDVDGE